MFDVCEWCGRPGHDYTEHREARAQVVNPHEWQIDPEDSEGTDTNWA